MTNQCNWVKQIDNAVGKARNSNDLLDFSQYQHIAFNGCSSSLMQVISETTLGILCTCRCGVPTPRMENTPTKAACQRKFTKPLQILQI